ncbi:unnamed protein product [Caenorhabditis sp. 36 PRJEB53466]|nr:unnamed protein product [Caenorhabditis sp. 36 PRJEB53466]
MAKTMSDYVRERIEYHQEVITGRHPDCARLFRLAGNGDQTEPYVRLSRGLLRIRPSDLMEAETKCTLCHRSFPNENFLEHIKNCAATDEKSKKQKEMEIHKFSGSIYSLLAPLKKAAFELEKEYMEALLTRKMNNLSCFGCDSLEEHARGKCLEDRNKTIFLTNVDQIASTALAHMEHYLNLRGRCLVDEMDSKDETDFQQLSKVVKTIEEEKDNRPSKYLFWTQFCHNTTTTNNGKRQKLEVQITLENARAYEEHKKKMEKAVDSLSEDLEVICAVLSREAQIINNMDPAFRFDRAPTREEVQKFEEKYPWMNDSRRIRRV